MPDAAVNEHGYLRPVEDHIRPPADRQRDCQRGTRGRGYGDREADDGPSRSIRHGLPAPRRSRGTEAYGGVGSSCVAAACWGGIGLGAKSLEANSTLK